MVPEALLTLGNVPGFPSTARNKTTENTLFIVCVNQYSWKVRLWGVPVTQRDKGACWTGLEGCVQLLLIFYLPIQSLFCFFVSMSQDYLFSFIYFNMWTPEHYTHMWALKLKAAYRYFNKSPLLINFNFLLMPYILCTVGSCWNSFRCFCTCTIMHVTKLELELELVVMLVLKCGWNGRRSAICFHKLVR